jgi:hypothetical protein
MRDDVQSPSCLLDKHVSVLQHFWMYLLWGGPALNIEYLDVIVPARLGTMGKPSSCPWVNDRSFLADFPRAGRDESTRI